MLARQLNGTAAASYAPYDMTLDDLETPESPQSPQDEPDPAELSEPLPAEQPPRPETLPSPEEEPQPKVFPSSTVARWQATLVPQPKFTVLQAWEGTVREVREDSLVVVLKDQGDEPQPDEEAEVYFDEIDPEDHDLVAPGAIFYWSIGYRDGRSGRERVSLIHFRRLPVYTDADRERARAAAKETADKLGWG